MRSRVLFETKPCVRDIVRRRRDCKNTDRRRGRNRSGHQNDRGDARNNRNRRRIHNRNRSHRILRRSHHNRRHIRHTRRIQTDPDNLQRSCRNRSKSQPSCRASGLPRADWAGPRQCKQRPVTCLRGSDPVAPAPDRTATAVGTLAVFPGCGFQPSSIRRAKMSGRERFRRAPRELFDASCGKAITRPPSVN